MKFNWDLIMQPHTVVHCDTEDKANELLSEATKENKAYYGISYWKDYKQDTCYNISKNQYCGLSYFKDNNFTILSFDDILIKEENKMKVKYDLQVFHNIVLFKVLEMDEKYRKGGVLFKSSNGLKINSEVCVSLSENSIYIIGKFSTEVDNTCLIKLNTSKEAQAYAEKVRFALEEWNNHEEIMEIEYKGVLFVSNFGYNLEVYDCGHYNTISISTKNNPSLSLKKYWVADDKESGFPLDKTIIMFNRDCELLNIPFRIKGEN